MEQSAKAGRVGLRGGPATAPQPESALPERPNVVILNMDDGGYGDLNCYGHPTIATPNLDRMAREGMRYTQFYSASPACTASRYALLTGRVPARSGFGWVLSPTSNRGLHPQEVTLAGALKARGYATGCFGKWHLGQREPWMPPQHGFDAWYGIPYSNDMIPPAFPDLPLYDGGRQVETNPDQATLTLELTRRATGFIREHRDEPFFVYLAYPKPHVPLHPAKAFAGKSRRGTYGDVVEEIDWSAGEILRALRDVGVDEKTLVVFSSDNGPWIIMEDRGGSAGLLRDGKGSTWEGGVRVPMIARWPGVVPAGTVNREVASTMDLFPTLVGLAGGEVPDDRMIDGRDMLDLLRGRSRAEPRDPLFFWGIHEELYAVRLGPWKLHVRTYSQTKREYFDGKLPLLFHLDQDPSEQYDRSESHPEVVAELSRLMDAHREAIARDGSFWDPPAKAEAEAGAGL